MGMLMNRTMDEQRKQNKKAEKQETAPVVEVKEEPVPEPAKKAGRRKATK